MYIYKIAIFNLLFSLSFFVYPQSIFVNPSFEGIPNASVPPSGWSSCGSLSTPDTQPGAFGVLLTPSNLSSYVGMVCRSAGSFETISQTLAYPLSKDSCYTFDIDIARSPNYAGHNNPALLRCWGGFSACVKSQNLWVSPPIERTNWQTYTIVISPSSNFTEIMFDVYYNSPDAYDGNVLIDNISKISVSSVSSQILGNDTALCKDNILTLDATKENATYLWQDNSTNSKFIADHEGTYWVEVTHNGCQATDTINIDYISSPIINLGSDTTLCEGKSFSLQVLDSYVSCLWQDNSTKPTLKVLEPGTYWVEVTNNCGLDSDTITISEEDCTCNLYLPNAFTPNSDNKNDNFFQLLVVIMFS